MPVLFRQKYRIPSIRAHWHDYGGGLYFVTICTKNHTPDFGVIKHHAITHSDIEDTMEFSSIGQFLHDNLQNASQHYPYIEIPLWQVMPNHAHLIVSIDSHKTPYSRRIDTQLNHLTANKRCAPSPQGGEECIEDKNRMHWTDTTKGWLSVYIGGLKSSVTKFAHSQGIPFAWQTRFYEHIITHQEELEEINRYIYNNVANWETDSLFTDSI